MLALAPGHVVVVIRASYPPETYRRLVDLKNQYDPTNLFHLNQNIAPSV